MIQNRIRDKRSRAGLSQSDVADRLPEDVNRIVMSFIEGGRVLPTLESMKTLCRLFGCSPEELYDPDELNLMAIEDPSNEILSDYGKGMQKSHEDKTEFRVWIKAGEMVELEDAVAKLGYHNSAEWFREAFRALLEKRIFIEMAESYQSPY